MGNDKLDMEAIIRDFTNSVFGTGYDQPFSYALVVGSHWTDWQEDALLRGRVLQRMS